MSAQERRSRLANQPAASSPAASEAAKPEAAEEEQTRTSSASKARWCKWTAKTLHLSVETTAQHLRGHQLSASSFWLIGIPLFRFCPSFFAARGEKVRTDIESARKATEDANARLSAIEAKLAGWTRRSRRFAPRWKRKASEDEARIKATIEEESARIVAAAEQEIDAAAAQARRGLRHFAADLAIDQAAKQLVLTPETDRALIAEFLSDASRERRSKGGQN